jgi:hypothetical protein
MQNLELDPVGVVEEDGVVARRVAVFAWLALNRRVAAAGEPAGALVHDLARGRRKRDVVDADRVALDRGKQATRRSRKGMSPGAPARCGMAIARRPRALAAEN